MSRPVRPGIFLRHYLECEHEWHPFAFQTSPRSRKQPQFALHKLWAPPGLVTPTGLLAVIAMLSKAQPGEPAPDAARRRRLFGRRFLFLLDIRRV